MTVELDLSEVHLLASDLVTGAEKIEPAARSAVARNAFQVVATAQVLTPVDTGALKNSISADIDSLSYEVGPTVEYGAYVELGTAGPYPIPNAFGTGTTVMHPGISPEPYLGPAFDRHDGDVADELGDAGERILA